MQVETLRARLAERRIELRLTPTAIGWLGGSGYSEVYGARPLRRLIQRAVGDELAKRLLSGEAKEGDVVVVDGDEDTLRFTVLTPTADRRTPSGSGQVPVVPGEASDGTATDS